MKSKRVVICNLRMLRKQNGLSQDQLSYLSGISQNTISSIENGVNNVSVYNALKLSNVLFCKVEDLFVLSDDELYS